jgi:mRNA-degrading endonuclease toxin of MazEF toxin-antitoxin module
MIFWGRVTRNETMGSEHHHDTPCPWVVLSSRVINGKLPIALVAPLTSKLSKDEGAAYRQFRIRIPASKRIDYELPEGQIPLKGDSLVLTEQLRVFAHERLEGNPVALLSLEPLAAIEAGLKHVLDLA